MKQPALRPFDPSRYLQNEASIAAYLEAVLEQGDSSLFLDALGDVAKARGMSRLAKESGLTRESLYRSLSSGSQPRFETIQRVLHALGVKIHLQALPA